MNPGSNSAAVDHHAQATELGDLVALFESLHREHASRIRGFVRRYVRDQSLVDDLVQETFLRAFRSIASFDPEP